MAVKRDTAHWETRRRKMPLLRPFGSCVAIKFISGDSASPMVISLASRPPKNAVTVAQRCRGAEKGEHFAHVACFSKDLFKNSGETGGTH